MHQVMNVPPRQSRRVLQLDTKENHGFWLHTSGAGILTWKDTETQTYGEAPSQPPYDDLENVSGLTSLPDTAFHRDIDKLVLALVRILLRQQLFAHSLSTDLVVDQETLEADKCIIW